MEKNQLHPRPLALMLFPLFWVLGAGGSADAQQSPSTPSQQPAPAPAQPVTPQTPSRADDHPTVQNPPSSKPPARNSDSPKDDRLFWALPNLLTVESSKQAPPLTASEEFILVTKGTFDPVEFAFLATESGINQASDSNPTFGRGLKGYGKRYALAFGDNVVENYLTGAVFPTLLHEDPRFYQMGSGSFLHRASYAGLRVLITRSNAGNNEFNWSEVLGAGSAALISNAYHPGPRTVGSNLDICGTEIAWDVVGYEMKEFWPDIHRRFMGNHRQSPLQ